MRFIGKNKNDRSGFRAVASGVLATGDTIVLNSDGTVSAAGISTTAQSSGSVELFESGQIDYPAVAYDSHNNRVVVAYRDYGRGSDGVAVVGTVTGSSISFGSEAVFETGTTAFIDCEFDSFNNKILIIFQDYSNSSKTKARVGTVDATNNTISFGQEAIIINAVSYQTTLSFDSNSNSFLFCGRLSSASLSPFYKFMAKVLTISGTSVSAGSFVGIGGSNDTHTTMDSCFDSNSNRVVVAARNVSASGRGTVWVGQITGTGVAFGNSGLQFELGSTDDISMAFDSNSNKVVIVYKDGNDSNFGKAIVGTVDPSNNTISLGTIRTFASKSVAQTTTTFDSSTNKMVIGYSDLSTSPTYAGKFCVANVSGTDITFETEQASADTEAVYFNAATFDSTSNQIVFAYRYHILSGKAFLFKNTITSTNLTANNFIGTTSDGYASGQTATINVSGFIDDSQSGLTLGQKYYVNDDGTLSTTSSNPYVFAGTAVSDTELRIGDSPPITLSSYTGDVDVTGEFIADSYNETYAAVTSSSGAVAFDCHTGNTFSHTMTEAVTSSAFNNPPASGTAYTMSVEIIQDSGASAYGFAWPTSVDWPAATAPTITATASAKDVFVFTTRDGGTTWYGFTAGQALA